jgi:hypothetical protein
MYVSPLQPPFFSRVIRLISFHHCSSVSSGFNSHDMLRGDQNATFFLFKNRKVLLFLA